MRSLRRHLEQLEGKTEQPVEDSGWYQRYLWMQRHYFPVLENYHREQKGLEPFPVPEQGPDLEFDAFWEHYLEAHEQNDPQMIRACYEPIGCSYVCQGIETEEGRAPGAVRIR